MIAPSVTTASFMLLYWLHPKHDCWNIELEYYGKYKALNYTNRTGWIVAEVFSSGKSVLWMHLNKQWSMRDFYLREL